MEATPSRYLCVSNGRMIYCLKLDLMSSNHQSFDEDVDKYPSLPLIATLDLMDNDVNIGLWKLGSDTCVIGGQHLNRAINVTGGCRYSHRPPEGHELYIALCVTCGLNASSRETNVLSLDASASTLSLSKSEIPLPQNPKVWPIVENIQGQTHVLNSIPYWGSYRQVDAFPSHEVFNPDSCSWSEISTNLEQVGLIYEHVVIGHHIYAVSHRSKLVFDSKAGNWYESDLVTWDESVLSMTSFEIFRDSFDLGAREYSFASNVYDVLRNGFGRCFGGVTYGDPSDLLRVLVAVLHQTILGEGFDWVDDFGNVKVFAEAYLVNSRGQIVCFQRLPEFFEGPNKPINRNAGVMIDADEEGNT